MQFEIWINHNDSYAQSKVVMILIIKKNVNCREQISVTHGWSYYAGSQYESFFFLWLDDILERRTAISACRFQDNKKLNGTEHLEYRKEICTEIYEISALIWHTQHKTKSIKETA